MYQQHSRFRGVGVFLIALAGWGFAGLGTGCTGLSSPSGDDLSVPVRGDVDGDGAITEADLNAIRDAFNTTQGDPQFNPSMDLNGDGTIGLADLRIETDLLAAQ
jgi:hypothetical protein